jgi:ABC-type nitrate/sulfonate/bicarbonate transport system substrate-binding protein
LALLLLAACAPQPPVFKPVTVDMPVAVPCRTAPVAKPDFALAQVAATDGLFDKARAALVELDQRKAYEAELESQLSICQ